MKSVIQWAVRNAPAMNTLMVGVLVVGTLSLWMLRREEFPEFELEIILVTVPYPGASPEEVETGICQKIEEAVRAIDGIKKMTSVAKEGAGNVVLELPADVPDVQKVLAEVRSEIDRIPSFPELAEDPEVKQITLRRPAIRVGIVGTDTGAPDEELQLREVAERVRDELLRLPSVTQAEILGARDYQIDIEIAEATLRRHGLSLQRVAEIVRRENIELPGGSMKSDTQEVLLRGKNKRLTGAGIARIPLLTQPSGVVLTVGDLGTVRDEFADTTSISRIDGNPGLVVSVDATSGEDLLNLSDEVHGYVAETSLPYGDEFSIWGDQAVNVRDRLELLSKNGLQGLVLVFLVLAVFLELRLAFWVALGIPVSMLGACGVLLYLGHTLNMLSMFAFLMALGIVVDDAIVIGENIYAHRRMGHGLIKAAVSGTYEVLPSVIASVATTITAFVPMMFVSGVMGKFFAVLPLAVIAMLVISLIESTFILPCHLAHSRQRADRLQPGGHAWRRVRRWPVPLRWTLGVPVMAVAFLVSQFAYPLMRLGDLFASINDLTARGLQWSIDRCYLPALRFSLHNPAVVVSAAAALLIFSLGAVRAGITPWILFPKLDSYAIEARVTYPNGTPGAVTDEATRRLEQAVRDVDKQFQQHGPKVVKVTHRAVGQVASPNPTGPEQRVDGSHVGNVYVELVDVAQRNVTSQQVIDAWRQASPKFPGAESVTFGSLAMGPAGAPIEFKLLADPAQMADLEAAVERCKEKLAEFPGVFDVDDDSRPGKWEFQLRIKENAAAMGIPLADLAETVRASYYGEEVMRLQRGRHEVKLMVRYPPEERASLADFYGIRVRTGGDVERPLTELAEVNVGRGYAEINRIDQMRSITVTADVDEATANASQIVQNLRTDFIPALLADFPGIEIRWEGQQEQTTESVRSLMLGFAMALLGMFVLLTLEFRSYVQPLLILLIVPFGAIGAVWGHAVMGLPLTLFSVLGMVALTGVVVNDSIVLTDFINARVTQGVPLIEALVDAGRRRLRPVLLTSVTTIVGLLPILTETSFQAQLLIPMATSVCFGLVVSTALVLLLVPTFYLLYARAVRVQTRESAAASDSAEPELAEAGAEIV